ncbi:hypothetical protein SMGD1_1550 [Sulfurimonas gotlandica GD1]|uniref:Uncharacterized protein n=1 Tax=Sulfurimonas gotlandica (strain DSM 19862 / JCM 16533 / GD1) TaxID=929558 RepID=B6BHS3_SULGG|nr:DUF2846 domain-containing protein [Sulfurimonas gotlandica]EDZ63709.1 conserved hypothetical protein [Sulfurimonas gotlandica GD1]EHP30074.1 hypothetical protein SMGD1_1550 [Sulfurimonas gotlandica GD1]
MKIIQILLLSATLLLVTACGNRTPFKKQEPLENAALVYIYALDNVSSSESSTASDYNIRINNKPYMERIKQGEYIVLNLKPQAMTISATKKQVEEKVLTLDFKTGHIYYLKIKDDLDNGAFEFQQVNNSIGSKEIIKTGLAGSSEESQENIITEFVNPKETESVEVKAVVAPVVAPIAIPQASTPAQSLSAPMSKTDEIMKAYGLKEKGIISDEEFKALKTNILNK